MPTGGFESAVWDDTWFRWSASTSTNSASYDTSNAWSEWASNGTSSTTVDSSMTWNAWTGSTARVQVHQSPPTNWRPSSFGRPRRRARDRERYWLGDRHRKVQARHRSKRLLLEHLNPTQRRQYREDGGFVVKTPSGRRYLISEGEIGNVHLLDDQDRRLTTLCIHPRDGVPVYDTMLAQKLLLQVCEEDFWRIGNIHSGRSHTPQEYVTAS